MPSFSLRSWRQEYSNREISPGQLDTIIRKGMRIYIGSAASEPVILTRELLHDKIRFTDCRLIHFLTLSDQKFWSNAYPTRFRHNTLSIIGSPQVREAVNEGRSDFTPVKLSQIPEMIRSRAIPIDVALLQVGPPDRFGYCSLGISCDINRTVADEAAMIIAQINPYMPRTSGDTMIPLERINYFVYAREPLIEYHHRVPVELEGRIEKIGRFAASLIEDGSTINVGLGRVPPALWKHFADKKDLAIYTESLVLTNTVMELVDTGVITCRRNIHPNIRASFALGTKEAYRYLHRNPFIELRPSEFMNNVANIARNYRMVSIYSAIAVDLTGHITNHFPDRFYTGNGGEIDFILGTSMAQNGKTIIVMPSTSSDGLHSRIVAEVGRSSVASADVHFVITEFGIASLRGKSFRESALALINIAHPKFREGLLAEAKRLRYVYKDQILVTRALYPEHYVWKEVIDGVTITFRPVKPTDEQAYQKFFYELPDQDRRMRFLGSREILHHEDAQAQVNIDYSSEMLIVGVVTQGENETIVCCGGYAKCHSGGIDCAELSLLIAPQWQRRGIGTILLERLSQIAVENAIMGFTGEVFADNAGMLTLLTNSPWMVEFINDEETLSFSFRFDSRDMR